MSNMARLLGVPDGGARFAGPLAGIEIEVENFNAYYRDLLFNGEGLAELPKAVYDSLNYWSYKEDGSLRNNGVELVSKPTEYASIAAVLDSGYAAIERAGARGAERTGLHVHLNCRYLSVDEFRRCLQSYLMFEPLLFDMAGVAREQNIYCVPLWQPKDTVKYLRLASGSAPPFTDMRTHILEGGVKYSALNLLPLASFGTVEFRMAPTWPTAELAKAWLRLVTRAWQPAGAIDPDLALEWANEAAGSVWSFSSKDYFYKLERYDIIAKANDIAPCTYKPSWGMPAGMSFEFPKARRTPEQNDEEARMAAVAGQLRNVRPNTPPTIAISRMLTAEDVTEFMYAEEPPPADFDPPEIEAFEYDDPEAQEESF